MCFYVRHMKKYNIVQILCIWWIFVLCFTGVCQGMQKLLFTWRLMGFIGLQGNHENQFELAELKFVFNFGCSLRWNGMYCMFTHIEHCCVVGTNDWVVCRDQVWRPWPSNFRPVGAQKRLFFQLVFHQAHSGWVIVIWNGPRVTKTETWEWPWQQSKGV